MTGYKAILLAGWTFLYCDPSQTVWMQKSKVFQDQVQCEIERETQYARIGKLSISKPKWTFLWWISPACHEVKQ